MVLMIVLRFRRRGAREGERRRKGREEEGWG